jgi:osmoprotectant transport system permease protein
MLAAVIGAAARTARAEPPAGAAGVGSKNFTESVILAEILRLEAQRHGLLLVHRRALGGTAILWQALLQGSVDVYPEYVGTLTQELLQGLPQPVNNAAIAQALQRRGLAMSAPLGFEDRYALGVAAAVAQRLQLHSLSDLSAHPELRFALSNEFMSRADGWPGLRAAYALSPASVRGMEHTLAYRAIAAGAADVVDVYTTDPEIESEHITVLSDDRHFFPSYQAVWLYRIDSAARWPALTQSFNALAARISLQSMRAMNSAVQIRHRDETAVAAEFVRRLNREHGAAAAPPASAAPLMQRLAVRTREHLALVATSLALALLLGLPLGVAAAKLPTFGRLVLAGSVVLQTVPTLAMLVFMIPLFGIGATPAIATLFFYSLLPIVRNTLTGLSSIPAPLEESAASLGLPEHVRLLRIELPLATPTIVAGISTAAVINVGTATLGALIGAGGYGEPILTGIRLNNLPLILEGAIPAALLALLVMGGFQLLERWLTPRGLRSQHDG